MGFTDEGTGALATDPCHNVLLTIPDHCTYSVCVVALLTRNRHFFPVLRKRGR